MAKGPGILVVQNDNNLAQLLTETCANFIERRDDGRVTAVRYKRPDGSVGRVQPRVLVVAANAMETPRLLLASRSSTLPAGVANRSGLVGCNLMDHPIQLSWALAREPVWPYRGPGSTSGIGVESRSPRIARIGVARAFLLRHVASRKPKDRGRALPPVREAENY